MAQKHQHVDQVTLKQVQELLADTQFASIDELARGIDLIDLAGSLDSSRPASVQSPSPATPGSLPPLPRRR